MSKFNRADFPESLETVEDYHDAGVFLVSEFAEREQRIAPLLVKLEMMEGDDEEAQKITEEIKNISGEMMEGEIGAFVKEVVALEQKLLEEGSINE